MPNPLIPLEYLPAARLGYPWGKGGTHWLAGKQAPHFLQALRSLSWCPLLAG